MTAREVAFLTVRDVFPFDGSPGRGAQEALEYRAGKEKLDVRDRAFCTHLVFGTIKMRRTLDWYLAPYIGQRGKALPPAIAEILRLGFYELLFSAAADHAVVSQWVNAAKRHGHRGTAGLVNAVFRGCLRDRPAPPQPADFENEDEYFGTLYSYPTWIVRQWRGVFGTQLEDLLKACNEPAHPAVTVNRKRQSREELQTRFAGRGIATQPSALSEDSLLLENGAALAADHEETGWWLQSESSAMVVDVLNPHSGEKIVDACSGRGSKALQIAARLDDANSLLCIDRERRKIETLERRAKNEGLNLTAIAGDATVPLLPQRVDRVLIDAPCSGLGVLGRHPEARWRKHPDDGERLALTQRALLDALVPQVFDGGAIVYAVCSTDPRETTEVIDWCLRAHNVERGLIPGRLAELQTAEGDLLVPPGLHGRDGFYVARLERR
ncbi:MAG TPA: transcription antitermination factor NusB [Candidatus Rubrimentiphilum sp.]|nr:transcription antitermination factor NusB [Candidatus Rubrimentiphilum sp.]